MKTLLCAIGRLENRYIREYVRHYKDLGFSAICLCDNNRTGEEDFRDEIGDFIDSGFVIIEDWRDKTRCQLAAYKRCFEKYRMQYDWIAFFDCDEFLTLNGFDSVGDYLGSGMFDRFDIIHVNWMIYGDCSQTRYSPQDVTVRFPEPVNAGDHPINRHVKSIIRGGRRKPLSLVRWKHCSPHTPYCINVRCCDASGHRCRLNSPFCEPDFTCAALHHYTTKTAEEFAGKLIRGFPDYLIDEKRTRDLVTLFFVQNELTEEKVGIFQKELGLDFSHLLSEKDS